MKTSTKRILVGIIGFVFSLFLFWMGGIDIFDRGVPSALAYLYGAIIAVVCASFPYIDKL